MATSGQFITLIGVTFFFLVLGFSHLETKHTIDESFGLSRWLKRVHYYLYKIRWNNHNEDMAAALPVSDARVFILEHQFNEYEVLRFTDDK